MPDTDDVLISADFLAFVLTQMEQLDQAEIEALIKAAAGAYIEGSSEGYILLKLKADFELVHKEALAYVDEYRDMLVNRGGSYCVIPDFDDIGNVAGYTNKFLPWAEEYSKTQRELISDTIKSGIEKGRSMQDLSGDISGVFDARDRRAEILVQTESRKHHVAGMKARYQDAYITEVEWSTAGSDVCPLCLPLEGQRFKMSEIPGGGPPIHPGCRCRLTAVIDLEAEITAMEGEIGEE